jgi:lipoprotein-anchoring transpeptidase ErfK/SrfK
MFKQLTLGMCAALVLAGSSMAANTVQDRLTTLNQEQAKEKSIAIQLQQENNKANPTSVAGSKDKTAPAPVKKVTEKKILLNLASRILTLYEGDTKIRMYPVGVGKVSTPTPTGYYSILSKAVDPVWVDPDNMDNKIDSGEDNPLGYRWMQFYGNYGIHGTNRPGSIGGYVSNGCVRMYEENVEDLYNFVSVGTPVQVYYDRIVIDRDADHTISYYIYPDGYGWQPLSVDTVRKALFGYGVDNFESDEAIADKIDASDGEPTYVAKAYGLKINGSLLSMKALRKDNVTYVPAEAVATALKLALDWNPQTGMLTSPYGTAPGYVKRNVVYCNAEDTGILFHLMGGLTDQLVYELSDVRSQTISLPAKA